MKERKEGRQEGNEKWACPQDNKINFCESGTGLSIVSKQIFPKCVKQWDIVGLPEMTVWK